MQRKMAEKAIISTMANAGPLWSLEAKSPVLTQSVYDQAKSFLEEQLGKECFSIFKGKSKMSEVRESAPSISYEALLSIISYSRSEAKEEGYRTQWPDMASKWSILKNNNIVMRGKLENKRMCTVIEINKKVMTENSERLKVQIENVAETHRVGFLLRPEIVVRDGINNPEADKDKWGKVPRKKF